MITQLESAKSRMQRFGEEMDARIQQQMQQQIECQVMHYARHPERIEERLRQLDQEWDLGRRFQANAAGIILGSLILGRAFRLLRPLPYIASGFLLMNAVRGWLRCWPMPPESRTRDEIEKEPHALRALLATGEMPADMQLDQKVERAAGSRLAHWLTRG